MGPPHHPGARPRKEAGQAKIGDHDHHPQQQGERVEVDRLVSILKGQRAAGDHQTGANQRRARAIDRQARDPADGQSQIARHEDRSRGGPAQLVLEGCVGRRRRRHACSHRDQHH